LGEGLCVSEPANRVYTLDLSLNAGIGDLGAASLAADLALHGCKGALLLRSVNLSAAGVATLAAAAKNLVELDCAHSEPCPDSLAALCEALGTASCIVALDLSSVIARQLPGFEDEGVTRLCPDGLTRAVTTMMAFKPARLQRLGLAGNKLGASGAQTIVNAIGQGAFSLTELNLDANCIGSSWRSTEMRSLSELLTLRRASAPELVGVTVRGLRVLEACDNLLDDAALALLAEGVRQSFALEILRLARNDVRDRGACCLADALVEQRVMLARPSRLDFRGCGLLELQLSMNPIGDTGLETIAEASCKVPSLEAPFGPWGLHVLAVAGHAASSRGIAALGQAVRLRRGLLERIHKAISGPSPPEQGGGDPPRLLRIDVLEAPSREDVLLEEHLLRSWEEHFGPSVDLEPSAHGAVDEVAALCLEADMRRIAAEREEARAALGASASATHMTFQEDPTMEESTPEDLNGGSWWNGVTSLLSNESAPDGLDEFWETDEPVTDQLSRRGSML